MDFESGDLAICVTCGTQYDAPLSSPPKSCRICDDPRQYVPPHGQSWSSLRSAQFSQKNHISPCSSNPKIHFITTTTRPENDPGFKPLHPSFPATKPLGIGERAIFIETPGGNILWDLISFLDQGTVEFIQKKGGLKAIVISHPHFWTTHLEWARVFDCPVYLNARDKQWLCREDKHGRRKLIEAETQEILPGVTAIRTGGHFDGSMVLHWKTEEGERILFHADSIMVVPAAYYHADRLPGTTSYSFMWSYPNMIPLAPDQILGIWKALKPFEFTATYGGFMTQDNRRPDLKNQLLESMKIFVRTAGHADVEILRESL